MSTLILGNELQQLDELLVTICQELQLPESLHRKAQERYAAVHAWLAADGSQIAAFDPQIYPQGSLAIGTTTKPLTRKEFDLDWVLELVLLDWRSTPALAVLSMIEARLREHAVYRTMLTRKKRCLCLTYADEFHMDILAAAPEQPPQGTRVRIPDREVQHWLSSDPRGFARWFQSRSEGFLKEARKAVQPLPDHEDEQEKTPLQKVVQLLKRWRDLRWMSTPDAAPRSVVLTTLAAEVYQSEMTTVEAFGAVVERMLEKCQSAREPLVVVNPSNPAEVLSEKWIEEPALFKKFVEMLTELRSRWLAIDSSSDEVDMAKMLDQLFGKEVTTTAFRKQAERVASARAGRTLGATVTSGTLAVLGSGVAPIRPNTFHGDS